MPSTMKIICKCYFEAPNERDIMSGNAKHTHKEKRREKEEDKVFHSYSVFLFLVDRYCGKFTNYFSWIISTFFCAKPSKVCNFDANKIWTAQQLRQQQQWKKYWMKTEQRHINLVGHTKNKKRKNENKKNERERVEKNKTVKRVNPDAYIAEVKMKNGKSAIFDT